MDGALIVEINSCRNRCLFCNPEGKKGLIPLRDVELHMLRQAKDLRKKGFTGLEISGCDPIEYGKIVGFINWLKEIGFRNIVLSTHGRDLSDIELAKRLKHAGLDSLRIPLYGSQPSVHDSVTQEEGSFSETLHGISNCSELGFRLQLTTLAMRQNWDEITETCSLFSRFTKDFSIGLPCISQLVDGKSFAVPLDELRTASSEWLKSGARIHDVPYCVIGRFDASIGQTSSPKTASVYSIPRVFVSEQKGVPSYRVKKRIEQCSYCRLRGSCDGFYAGYLGIWDVKKLVAIR